MSDTDSLPSRSAFPERSSGQTVDLGSVFRRQARFVLCGVVIGSLLGAAFYLLVRPQYESHAQLLIMRKDPRLATQGVERAGDSDARISDALLATQMQIVRSRRIVNQALERNKLNQLPSLQAEVAEGVSPTKYVIDHLRVTRGAEGPSREAHVLNVAFAHSSAQDARAILEAIVAEYQAYLREHFHDFNKEAADLIAAARTTLEEDLRSATVAYREHREQAPILSTGLDSKNVHRQRYEELQRELSKLAIQMNAAEVRLDIVQDAMRQHATDDASDLQLLALIDEQNAQRVRIMLDVEQGNADRVEFLSQQPARLQSAKSEYQELLALLLQEKRLAEQYGPRHPHVVDIRNQIAVAESFIEDRGEALAVAEGQSELDAREIADAYLGILRNDLQALRQRKSDLERLADTEEQQARTLIASELEGESLRKRIGYYQGLYDVALERLHDLNLAKEYGGIIHDLIGAPEAGRKVWPSLTMSLAIGGLLGFVLGSGFGVTRELQARCFRSPEEVRAALGTPILAHIPLAGAIAASDQPEGTRLGGRMWSVQAPNSREAEAIRSLRTSLFARQTSGEPVAIAVTSPQDGEGKTTIAANLAVSIARAGLRVLLVDCDLRKPAIHEALGIDNQEGLSSVMSAGSEIEPWDVIQPTPIDQLWVLPSGPATENSAELLASAGFENWLEVARQHYDYVILDCPPVLASADAAIIAGVADLVALVVRVASQNRPRAIRAKELLTDVNARLLGTVINGYEWQGSWQTRSYDVGGTQLGRYQTSRASSST